MQASLWLCTLQLCWCRYIHYHASRFGESCVVRLSLQQLQSVSLSDSLYMNISICENRLQWCATFIHGFRHLTESQTANLLKYPQSMTVVGWPMIELHTHRKNAIPSSAPLEGCDQQIKSQKNHLWSVLALMHYRRTFVTKVIRLREHTAQVMPPVSILTFQHTAAWVPDTCRKQASKVSTLLQQLNMQGTIKVSNKSNECNIKWANCFSIETTSRTKTTLQSAFLSVWSITILMLLHTQFKYVSTAKA